MIQSIVSRIDDMPGFVKCLVFKRMNVGWKNLKCTWHDCISKAIEDYINVYTLISFTREFLFKLAAHMVIFPDVGFKVNALPCSITCAKHRLIQVTSIIINLDCILSDFYFFHVAMWEASSMSVLSAYH